MSTRSWLGTAIVLGWVATAQAQAPAPEQVPAAVSPDAASEGANAAASTTPSNDEEAARAHFKMGVDFYRERNFRAALIEFQRAYRAAPHYKLLYNLGQASVELQEYAPAIDYLSGYLRAGRDEVDESRRKEVEQTILELEARIATVTIECEEGASIFVDDMLIGRAPLDHLIRVGAGRRRFSAERENGQRAERVLDVAAGDHLTVPLRFEDKSDAVDAVEAAATPTPSSSTSATPWAIATTAVLAAAAGTTAVLTALAQKDYKDERRRETTRTSLETLRDDAKTKALVTDILLSATLASAIVTTVLILSDSGEPPESNEQARLRSQPSVSISVGLGAIAIGGTL